MAITLELIAIVVFVLTFLTMPLDAIGTMLGLFSVKGVMVALGLAGVAWGLVTFVAPFVALIEPSGAVLLTVAVGFAAATAVNKLREHFELERSVALELERRDQRERSGVDLAGRVSALKRTGLKINGQPQVELHVEAELPDGRGFEGAVTLLTDEDRLAALQPGAAVGLRVVPQSPDNFELDLHAVPAGESTKIETLLDAASDDDERPSMTGAPIPWPLWIFGLQDAEAWLLPPRREAALPLVIVDLCDPFDEGSTPEREAVIDSAAYLLAERIWLHTDLPVSAAVFVSETQRKVLQPTGGMFEYDALMPFLTTLDPFPATARGEAGEDLDTDGLTLKLRMPGDEAERTLSAPVGELPEMLIDWLVRKELCRRIEPPSWYAAPDRALLADYARALDNLQLQVIADRKNRFIGRHSAKAHKGFVAHVQQMLAQYPEAGEQLKLLALTTAHYAQRDGRLELTQRQWAAALVEAVHDPAHPVYRLSPLLLHQFGEPARASSRRMNLRTRAEGAYAKWLDDLDLE